MRKQLSFWIEFVVVGAAVWFVMYWFAAFLIYLYQDWGEVTYYGFAAFWFLVACPILCWLERRGWY